MKPSRKTLLKKIFGSSIITLIGMVILVYIFISFGKEYVRRYQVNKEIDQLQKEVVKLEGENLKFVELVGYLNSNQFVEKEARDKLGYGQPGEKSIIIENNNQAKDNLINQPDAQASKIVENIKDLPNPNKWWVYFFQ